MYNYPDNLKSKATLGLWELRDIGIIGIAALLSLILITQLKFMPPIVFTAVYAFLTIRFDDVSILDFMRYSCSFFLFTPKYYEWRCKD